MYEIVLAANIVREIVVAQAAWALPLVVVFIVLVVAAFLRRGDWRGSWRPAWISGVLAFIAACFALPGLSGAAWSDLSYFVDWAMLVALAAGFGAVVAAFVWSASAALRRPRGSRRPLAQAGAAG